MSNPGPFFDPYSADYRGRLDDAAEAIRYARNGSLTRDLRMAVLQEALVQLQRAMEALL